MRRFDRLTDAELLEQARREPEAFGVFYDRHVHMIMGFIMKATRDSERALDLTAEVFAAALAGSRRFEREGPPASAWLVGIARNKMAAARRREALTIQARHKLGIPRLDFNDDELERVEQLFDAAGSNFGAALEQLPDAERVAVTARVLDERDYADIAKAEGTSEPAIRQRVSRGLARLRSDTPEGINDY